MDLGNPDMGESPDPFERALRLPTIEEEAPEEQVRAATRIEHGLSSSGDEGVVAGYLKAAERLPENLVLGAHLSALLLRYGLFEEAIAALLQLIDRMPDSISLRHDLFRAYIWAEHYDEAIRVLLEIEGLLSSRGQPDQALEVLSLAVGLGPDRIEARRRMVDILLETAQPRLATHHLQQLADAAVASGDHEVAVQAYTRLSELGDDPAVLSRLAQLHEGRADTDSAAALYRTLVERHESDSQWQQAAEAAERLAEITADDPGLRRKLIDLYDRMGDAQSSLRHRIRLGAAYRDRGQLDEARALFEDAFRRHPRDVDLRHQLALVYLAQGALEDARMHVDVLTGHYLNSDNLSGAIDLFENLVRADPDSIKHRDALIRFYGMAGRVDEVVEQMLGLATAHQRAGSPEEAFKVYDQAAEFAPRRAEVYQAASRLALDQGDRPRALRYLRRGSQPESDPAAAEQLLRLLIEGGEMDEAGRLLQRPDFSEQGQRLAEQLLATADRTKLPGDRLVAGATCVLLGRLDEAIEQLQRIRSEPGFELQAYTLLGRAFAEQSGFNMRQLGIDQVRKGLRLEGYPPEQYLEARYQLALLLYQDGQVEQAREQFEMVVGQQATFRDVRSWLERLRSDR